MRWYPYSNPEKGEPMYQVYCMMNTPPQTFDEQEKCLNSRTRCWRHAAEILGKDEKQDYGAKIPLDSVKRRKPA
jgi:hypothetical protein